MTQKLKYHLGMVKYNLGKGENAGYQHFLLSQQGFQQLPLAVFLKVEINSLSDFNILDWFILKAFADGQRNIQIVRCFW